VIFFFNEGNQESIACDLNDHDLLPRVLRRVLVRYDFQQAACFHRDGDVLKGNASPVLEQVILGGWPPERFHRSR